MQNLALLPDAIDPDHLLSSFGLLGLLIIVFAECGLLVGFFLPGDTLLFSAGLLTATGTLDVPFWVSLVLVPIAAIAGNLVGYWIGYQAGPAVFNKPDSRIFRQEYVDRSHDFFERYGARTIVLARFVPIVRTFATVMAGASRMRLAVYAAYSVVGGILGRTADRADHRGGGAGVAGAGRDRADPVPAPARRHVGRAAGVGSGRPRRRDRLRPAPQRLMATTTERQPAECWLTDMDGVLVHEGVPVPGAQEFIQALEKSGIFFIVLSNN